MLCVVVCPIACAPPLGFHCVNLLRSRFASNGCHRRQRYAACWVPISPNVAARCRFFAVENDGVRQWSRGGTMACETFEHMRLKCVFHGGVNGNDACSSGGGNRLGYVISNLLNNISSSAPTLRTSPTSPGNVRIRWMHTLVTRKPIHAHSSAHALICIAARLRRPEW